MANASESEFERLVQIIKSGSTFESLRAAENLAQLSRKHRKSIDEKIRTEVEAALKTAKTSPQQKARDLADTSDSEIQSAEPDFDDEEL